MKTRLQVLDIELGNQTVGDACFSLNLDSPHRGDVQTYQTNLSLQILVAGVSEGTFGVYDGERTSEMLLVERSARAVQLIK